MNPLELSYLKNEESLDDLILGDMKIMQSKVGYRFSIDAVLLANFADIEKAHNILDLGTGNAVIPLLLSHRARDLEINAVEIQKEMYERAIRNIELNNKAQQIKIFNTDIKEIEKYFLPASFDCTISNPPFWKKGEGKTSKHIEAAIARHEIEIDLEGIVEKSAYLLKTGGKMSIIHRSDRLLELLDLCQKNKIYPSRLRMIHSFIDSSAKLFLLEATNKKRTSMQIMQACIIYEQPGIYSKEICRIYDR